MLKLNIGERSPAMKASIIFDYRKHCHLAVHRVVSLPRLNNRILPF